MQKNNKNNNLTNLKMMLGKIGMICMAYGNAVDRWMIWYGVVACDCGWYITTNDNF